MLVAFGGGGNFENTLVISETTEEPTTSQKDVPYSRKLTEFDHNKILVVTSNVILTIPENGLQDKFRTDIDVLGGASVEMTAENANIDLDFPSGVKLASQKMGTIYRRSKRGYRGKGEFNI